MKATLILRSPLLKGLNRGDKLDSAVATSSAELERDIKENIQRSIPTGRTYRRGAILGAPSRRNVGLDLRRRGRKVVVGFKFHRASSKGQPPAIDTGRLINSIGSRRIGFLKSRVATSVVYSLPLDDPAGLNRPFFSSRVELYRPRFFANVRRAYVG